MTVQELIRKYKIEDGKFYGKPGMVYIPNPKKLPAAVIEELRARKNEILAELKAQAEAEERRRAEEKAAREKLLAQIEAEILSGQRKIRLEWHEGEVLSGYELAGSPEERHIAEKLLSGLGIGKYICMWGYLVPTEVAEALGTEFTYADVEKLTYPAREAEAQKKAEAEAVRATKFEEARKTGKPMELRRHTEPCDGTVEECSLDIVIEYAMPDGTTRTERIHTF